jgi:hypothetical protein
MTSSSRTRASNDVESRASAAFRPEASRGRGEKKKKMTSRGMVDAFFAHLRSPRSRPERARPRDATASSTRARGSDARAEG